MSIGALEQSLELDYSVVRASVSDWRTFPDMCLICG